MLLRTIADLKSCSYSFSEFRKGRPGSHLTSVKEQQIVKLHGDNGDK